MNNPRRLLLFALVLCLTASMAVPVTASSFVRMSLEELNEAHQTIVLAEVLDTYSYWNDAGTFIFTNVRLETREVVKGSVGSDQFLVTLMGGTVDDLTNLVLGTAELEIGNSYLLFLNEGRLPGAKVERTVRAHGQGAFDIVATKDGGLRAVSQASHLVMHPDKSGEAMAPGGAEGFNLNQLIATLRSMDQEVAQ